MLYSLRVSINSSHYNQVIRNKIMDRHTLLVEAQDLAERINRLRFEGERIPAAFTVRVCEIMDILTDEKE